MFCSDLLSVWVLSSNLQLKSGFLKTNLHWQAGSPAIHADGDEDGAAADGGNDLHCSDNQNEKQKISELMLSWHVSYGRGEDIGAPEYDKEIPHNHIPLLTNETDVRFVPFFFFIYNNMLSCRQGILESVY